MIPVLFKLGPLTVYSYGMMMALGFLAADFVISSECKRRGLNRDFASSLVVWAAICGIACSRLYSVIDNFPAYVHDPWSIIFSGSGFVWYGGLIGGLLSSYFVARYYKINFWVAADMAGPALVIGQALGRIGCHLSGDGDWGMPTKLPWGVAYPNAIVGWNGNTVLKLDSQDHLVSAFYPGVHVHPTPIYEAILYTLIFLFLWSRRKETKVPGQLFLSIPDARGSGALHGRVPAGESARVHGPERGAIDCDHHDDSRRHFVRLFFYHQVKIRNLREQSRSGR